MKLTQHRPEQKINFLWPNDDNNDILVASPVCLCIMWVGLDVHSCNNPDMHNIRQQRFAYSSVHSLFRSILHLQHEMHILQAMNAAEVWQWGYRSIHFLAQYSLSPLLGWPCLAKNKAQVKWRCGSFWQAMAVNFGFGVGTCMGTFKQLFHATAHPPSCGAWAALGQYGGDY